MNQYIITLKHDKGTFKMRVIAENEQAAKEMIMKAENCPLCAIIRIREARYFKKDGNN